MLEILLAVLSLGGLLAIVRQALAWRAARETRDAAEAAAEEWQRRQKERNRRRVDRQAQLAEWTGQFNALLLERRLRQSRPEPKGEPIAYIRAWGGQIVGTIYDDPPDYRASNAAALAAEQKEWTP